MYRAFKIEMKMIRRELWKQLRRLTKTIKDENYKHRKFCSKCRKILANSDKLSGKKLSFHISIVYALYSMAIVYSA